MNCLDALEGNIRSILTRLFDVYIEDNLDDSEYIRNVKAVIVATDGFVRNHSEITDAPHILVKVLYSFSKEMWIRHLKEKIRNEQLSENSEVVDGEYGEESYHEYYYDYIYQHGIHPP